MQRSTSAPNQPTRWSSALVLTDEDGGKTRTFANLGRSFPSAGYGRQPLFPFRKLEKQTGKNRRLAYFELRRKPPCLGSSRGRPRVKGNHSPLPSSPNPISRRWKKALPTTAKECPFRPWAADPTCTDTIGRTRRMPQAPLTNGKIFPNRQALERSLQIRRCVRQVALPFAMELYGKTFKEVFVSSNGFVTLGQGSTEHGHFPLPTTMMPGNLIAPFAMDLDPSRGGSVHVQETSNELLVQWNKVKDFAGIGEYTFQASLNRNGVIYFHYEKMDGKIERATTGIQNGTADQALLVAYNNKQVKADSTIRISTSPKWLHVARTAGTIAGGKYLNVPVTFKSGGILGGKLRSNHRN